jgi:hypothetical protein
MLPPAVEASTEQSPDKPVRHSGEIGFAPQVLSTHVGCTVYTTLLVLVRTHTWPAAHVMASGDTPTPSQVTEPHAVVATDHVPAAQVARVRPLPAQSS